MMGRPRGSGRRPARFVVERIIASVGAGRDITVARDRASTRLRRQAWAQILAETGCSVSGLADVWGCDRQAIHRTQSRDRRDLPAQNPQRQRSEVSANG